MTTWEEKCRAEALRREAKDKAYATVEQLPHHQLFTIKELSSIVVALVNYERCDKDVLSKVLQYMANQIPE